MAVVTHDSKWRMLVGAAPLLGVAFLVVAAVQGEPEVAKSEPVEAILAGVAALGLIVSAWTSFSLRAVPARAIAQAAPGTVALRGLARAVPGWSPLVSPDGVPCLWFKHSDRTMHRYNASDSVRPFLLVDASGSCLVLPAGADVTGTSRRAPKPLTRGPAGVTDITGSGTGGYGTGERLLLEGDEVHVFGRLVPVSAESVELQQRTAGLVEKAELPRVVIRSSDPVAFAQATDAAPPPLPPATTVPAPTALPVVAAPAGTEPFIVSIASGDGQGGFYAFLAVLDAIILAGSGGAWLWLQHVAR